MDLAALKQRIGIDLGRKHAVEEGIDWAARHEVRVVDAGFTGHYMNAFGTREDMLAGREHYLQALARG